MRCSCATAAAAVQQAEVATEGIEQGAEADMLSYGVLQMRLVLSLPFCLSLSFVFGSFCYSVH